MVFHPTTSRGFGGGGEAGGGLHEHLVNQILDDLLKVLHPHYIRVTGVFNIRGGIGITVEAEHIKTPAAKKIIG